MTEKCIPCVEMSVLSLEQG